MRGLLAKLLSGQIRLTGAHRGAAPARSTNRTQDTVVIPWPGSDRGGAAPRPVFTDLTCWDPLVAALGNRRTVRYDVRGHGTAAGVPVPEPGVLAADLVALLDRFDLADVHLVGHS